MDSEGPDQTAQMHRTIWAFTVRICPRTRFRMAWPQFLGRPDFKAPSGGQQRLFARMRGCSSLFSRRLFHTLHLFCDYFFLISFLFVPNTVPRYRGISSRAFPVYLCLVIVAFPVYLCPLSWHSLCIFASLCMT